MKYDIFISYKRKSLPTANNLYYRLTTRGYSVFFDLEEMGRDNFSIQLQSYIDNAKDVFIILEEGSLDACKRDNWKNDWFCREIAYALEKKKNIIPILIGGFNMPPDEFFPNELKELSLKSAPEFNYSYFESYINKLIEKNYLLSKPDLQEKATSVFKFYSNENCQVFKDGKLVCSLEGMSDEPYYLPVPRKGDFRFKVINASTNETRIITEEIDAFEEKSIEITWKHGLKIKNNFCKNKKGCSITISVLLFLFAVLIPLSIWKNANMMKNRDIQTQPPVENNLDSICLPVDLGLPSGTLWGDRNIGAKAPYDCGSLFAWGETETKTHYNEDNYNLVSSPKCIASTKLDIAYLTLGEGWSLPSAEQFEELRNECTWYKYESDSIWGFRIIGPNNNEIIIPANGFLDENLDENFGYYWTSEISFPKRFAKEFYFTIDRKSSPHQGVMNIANGPRFRGQSVRPVYRIIAVVD